MSDGFIILLFWRNQPCPDVLWWEPTLWSARYPRQEAWPQGRTIAVIRFDTPDPVDFQSISDGIRFWNSQQGLNCSNVTFQMASAADHSYVTSEFIPDDTIYVIRPAAPTGQMDRELRNPNTEFQNVRAALMSIENARTHSNTGVSALNRTAAHEAGHSLGLRDESSPKQPDRSITGIAYPTPTSCDLDAVKRVYCPTPSPSQPPTPYEEYCLPNPDSHGFGVMPA
jgi:hypothetical protein